MAAEGDITRGKEIFEGTCRGCHMGGNNFIKEKKTLKKDALEQFVGLDQENIEAFFRSSLVHKGPDDWWQIERPRDCGRDYVCC